MDTLPHIFDYRAITSSPAAYIPAIPEIRLKHPFISITDTFSTRIPHGLTSKPDFNQIEALKVN